jgi:hypothetical protein
MTAILLKNHLFNQKWTNQRVWQQEGAIKNGQTRETGNKGHTK